MPRYAEGTSVGADRSRAELEKLLRRFGAKQFGYAWDEDTGLEQIAFHLAGKQVRMTLPLPSPTDPDIRLTTAGRLRSESAQEQAYDQEVRRRWRSLVLVVKAKLTAVTDGISTIEREFMADVVLPSGQTVVEWIGPALESGDLTAITSGGRR